MKNISTGFGLCVLGLGVALWPIMDRFAPSAREAHAGVPTAAIASAVMGQAAPTIVWHGVVTQDASDTYTRQYPVLMGAWSNGQVEAKKFYMGQFSSSWCNNNFTACSSNWYVINDPAQGLAAASDSNFDAQVDGADLALLLGNRGDAPRDQIPSSDCPLNLINP